MIKEIESSDFEEVKTIIDQVHKIHFEGNKEIFSEDRNFNQKEFNELLENNILLGFIKNNKIVGLLVSSIRTKKSLVQQEVKLFDIDIIGVLETERGKGIGKQLLNKAEEIAINNNCDSISLNVWEFNKKALNFYEQNNFKCIRRDLRKNIK